MQLTKPVTPWWFWLASVLFVIWNAGGAYDYLMIHTDNPAYLAKAAEAAPEAVAYLDEMPAWRVVLWALAVWGGFAGSVLLLLRRDLAVGAYLVSLAGLGGGLLADMTVLGIADMYGGAQLVMTGAILVGAVVQLWFARFARRAGFLL